MNILVDIRRNSLFWEPIVKELKSTLKCSKHEVFVAPQNENVLKNINLLVTTRLDLTVLDSLPQLIAVFTPSSGIDHFPIQHLIKRSIQLYKSQASAPVVAERALALSLSLLGKIVNHDKQMRIGDWFNNNHKGTYWRSMENMNVGIFGFGQIAKSLVSLIQPFRCNIHTLERYEERCVIKATFHKNLKEVCRACDLLFLLAPLTEETSGILNKECLNEMKNGYLVNVSRAELVSETDLYESLLTNFLSGAALDVWYNYPDKIKKEICLPANLPFHELDNVILSPHASTHTNDAKKLAMLDTFNSVQLFLNGNFPSTCVNLIKGY